MTIATGVLQRAAPGIAGLDDALQLLMPGAREGEAGICVILAETEEELRDGARSHGWEISDLVHIVELLPPESALDAEQHQSLLYSSDLERGGTIQRLFEAIERLKPQRVVVESIEDPPAGAKLAAVPPAIL